MLVSCPGHICSWYVFSRSEARSLPDKTSEGKHLHSDLSKGPRTRPYSVSDGSQDYMVFNRSFCPETPTLRHSRSTKF